MRLFNSKYLVLVFISVVLGNGCKYLKKNKSSDSSKIIEKDIFIPLDLTHLKDIEESNGCVRLAMSTLQTHYLYLGEYENVSRFELLNHDFGSSEAEQKDGRIKKILLLTSEGRKIEVNGELPEKIIGQEKVGCTLSDPVTIVAMSISGFTVNSYIQGTKRLNVQLQDENNEILDVLHQNCAKNYPVETRLVEVFRKAYGGEDGKIVCQLD